MYKIEKNVFNLNKNLISVDLHQLQSLAYGPVTPTMCVISTMFGKMIQLKQKSEIRTKLEQ